MDATPRQQMIVDVAVMVAAWAAARAPFLGAFDLVSFDGTFYITQASRMFSTSAGMGGSFPPGYPALIALFSTVIDDGVRAAQAVSAVASLVATLALYALARRFVARVPALLCALVFTATPVFVRASLTTMSEATYVAWVLLGLVAVAQRRSVWAGLALGAAAVTRPEALAIAVVVGAVCARDDVGRESILRYATAFLCVYMLNVVAPTPEGTISLVPKWHLFGIGARDWHDLDATLDGGGRARGVGLFAVFESYVRAFPGDVARLFAQVAGVAFFFAVVGALRRRTFVLAAAVPFFVIPLFTFREESRFTVPFVPVCILYAFMGATSLTSKRAARTALAALVVAAAAGLFIHRAELTRPESEGFAAARAAGLALRDRIEPGARIADRKPYVAFYAGAQYVEHPRGRYESVMADLYVRADYIALMRGVTDYFRPVLTCLLYDDTAILGEIRFAQFYANEGGVMVYHRVDGAGADGGLTVTPVARLGAGAIGAGLSLSPGGARIAVSGGGNARAILVVDGTGDTSAPPESLVVRGARVADPAWSPDGERVAFVSMESGNPDVFVVDVNDGAVRRLTDSPARDVDPAWDGSGAVVFASDRTGTPQIWKVELKGGEATQLTFADGARRARVSPDETRMAWVNAEGRLVVDDRARHVRWIAPAPRRVTSAPAWSPDGLCLAVSASDFGDADVFLVRPDGTRALRLTKYYGNEDSPDWHTTPDGRDGLAVVMDLGGTRGVSLVEGIAPYRSWLDNPSNLRVFNRPTASTPLTMSSP